MNKEITSNICKTVICPICKEFCDWKYPSPPSCSWICLLCRWDLKDNPGKYSMHAAKTVICPRCKESFGWKYPFLPSRGWICWYCRCTLNMRNPSSYFRPRLMNDMEERRLEEYWDCEPEEVYQFGPESQEEVLKEIFDGGLALNDKKEEEACAG